MKKQDQLFDENQLKVKELNEINFELFHDLQKYVFQHQKDIVKANIILSAILDQMNQSQKPIVISKGMKNYVSQIEKSINMKEQLQMIKKQFIDKFTISGLWQTMCSYIVLLFIKELITGHYLIHFSIDMLVSIVAFYIALHNIMNEYKLIQRFQMTKKPIIMIACTLIIALFVAVIGAKSPFDVSFVILVIGYIVSKKMFENEFNI